MKNQRQYKRFHLDALSIKGKMSLADKVRILDIGLGGVALKVDRRLNIGREYMIRLGVKAQAIDVKGVVVRSTLSGIEVDSKGEGVSIYTAAMMFKEGSAERVAEFLRSISQERKDKEVVRADLSA